MAAEKTRLENQILHFSKQGKWDEMGTLITDEIVEAFAIVAEPDDVATQLKARYGDILDRVAAMVPFADRTKQQEFIETLRK